MCSGTRKFSGCRREKRAADKSQAGARNWSCRDARENWRWRIEQREVEQHQEEARETKRGAFAGSWECWRKHQAFGKGKGCKLRFLKI